MKKGELRRLGSTTRTGIRTRNLWTRSDSSVFTTQSRPVLFRVVPKRMLITGKVSEVMMGA